MSKRRNNGNVRGQSAAGQRLLKDLANMNLQSQLESEVDDDMLSLIVDEILKGEDISRRHPALFQKLLENAGLRQALLDTLVSVEAERAHQMIPMPKTSKADLSFILNQTPRPLVEILNEHKWRGTWRRTLEQIQAIFSPPELAYRADPGQFEDPWFTLLRDEMEASGIVYAVALECTLSGETDEALSAFLNLAVTLSTSSETPQFPFQATLQWGEYQEMILITSEGRVRFPEIPLANVMDEGYRNVKSGLSLSLEPVS